MTALREAAVFLGAMVALALGVFVAGWALIHAGGWILRGWFSLLGFLPRPAALALAILLAALTVYAATHWLTERRRAKRGLKA